MTARAGDSPAADRGGVDLRFRRPAEADHERIVTRVDEWWGGRRLHDLLPRLWLQHFSGTSWIVETASGDLAGFLVGFVSPDEPSVGYVHLVGTGPNHRRRGIGRELYRRFIDDVAGRGVREIRAITWPGNRSSVAFHRSIGFEPLAGPGSRNLYGTPAFAAYDYPGDERVVFRLDLPEARR
jgi:ribosomal protein S18 acetylase RimI-like enzyme